MKTSLETENNFKLSKIELLPMNDISNSYGNLLEKYKFTGHERDQNTNYDYMHFRFYASSMGRFLKPDNIIPDITNPQNWNAYTYVKGNPVNFNEPTGHLENQPPEQENKQNEQVGPTQPTTQNQEAMKKQEQKMVDQPKKTGDELKDPSSMQLSQEGLVFISKNEGSVEKVYEDSAGNLTAGVGHLLTSEEKKKYKKGDVVDETTRKQWLKEDIKVAETAVQKSITTKITQYQFDAVVDFAFNIGTNSFKKSQLVKDINLQKTDALTIEKDFKNWGKPKEIIGRREKEILLFTKGKY